MSNKLTIKQSKFCDAYIITGNASAAYKVAYNTANMKSATINRKAKYTKDLDKIRARIAELQELSATAHELDVDSITLELRSLIELSKENKNYSVAVSAIVALAKLHGLMAGKVEITHPQSMEEILQEISTQECLYPNSATEEAKEMPSLARKDLE